MAHKVAKSSDQPRKKKKKKAGCSKARGEGPRVQTGERGMWLPVARARVPRSASWVCEPQVTLNSQKRATWQLVVIFISSNTITDEFSSLSLPLWHCSYHLPDICWGRFLGVILQWSGTESPPHSCPAGLGLFISESTRPPSDSITSPLAWEGGTQTVVTAGHFPQVRHPEQWIREEGQENNWITGRVLGEIQLEATSQMLPTSVEEIKDVKALGSGK